MDYLVQFIAYLILFAVMVGIVILAIYCGSKLRKRSDAKKQAEAEQAALEADEENK